MNTSGVAWRSVALLASGERQDDEESYDKQHIHGGCHSLNRRAVPCRARATHEGGGGESGRDGW